ncbi:MAG: hypothetical protein JGK17_21350 [Microcoleus sp. PH2017_10_PVI_O_A]|uniref:hypothetical protein n=1 Tax=unclassified Microcoleus TaxID=2642155 RepID=UPI001DA33BEA|nr:MULTISPECIES: hypothetical protein [unclassified Microcoleus]MCC3462204.1 hypothetical protein [Microcoleus sp. PH2017_11_PCY_U_A]MCC3408084.1 hypothetical protein [Microcoleus sp. PH2017_10_PVI_O_A]MCC3480635.1 hypothetical protein [Microcoleus sp. PH2017_12_PCY_D_A]MCC3531333.1 hypothetical protein [Microcoleus sp. PH2017_21_RUC_O_A]MCC3543640.1 hypothetical protein [Microcoleus sp. PH2017_22_RUC_O_B]
MDWYARRVRSPDRKIRAIALWEEMGDRASGKKGDRLTAEKRQVAIAYLMT